MNGAHYRKEGGDGCMLSGFSAYLPEDILTKWDNLEFLIRILLAAILGILIGLERSRRQKDAGTRTHCIIAVTSAAIMILSKYAFVDIASVDGLRGADPARIAAQVVSGISFLGAGVIFKDRNSSSIKGLTTAAGMWATSAVGLAVGAGLYWLGAMETAVVVISQTVLHRFPVANDALSTQELCVRIADTAEMQRCVHSFIERHGGHIEHQDIVREGGVLEMKLTIRCQEPVTQEEGMALIAENKDILRISV